MGPTPRQFLPQTTRPAADLIRDATERPSGRRRAVAMAGMFATVLLLSSSPGIVSAIPRDAVIDQAERQKADARRQQAEIAAALDVAKASNDEVIAALATLDQQVQAETAKLNEAQRALTDADKRLTDLQAQSAESQHQVDRINNDLRQQALRQYVTPEEADTSMRLLKASDFDEAEHRKVLANTVSGNALDLIEQMRAGKTKLDELRGQAADARAAAETAKRDQEALTGNLKADIEAQSKVRVEWDHRVGSLQAAQDTLQRNQTDLDRVIAEQKAQGADATLAPNRTAPAPSPGAGRFQWPMMGRISQEYGGRNGHPGMDIAAPSGTPIYAALGGRVSFAGPNNGGYGNLVILDHGNGLQTYYAHQSRLAVSVGQNVSGGQQIGYEGSTGRSTGPHLHFETRVGGNTQNPRNYLPPGP